jgi:hypothetical protein
MACGWIRGGPSCLQTTIAIRAITSASPARSVGGFAAHMPGSFVIQAIAYYGKLAIHPTPLTSFARTLGTCRHWPDPGRFSHCCGSAFSWRLGRGRACHPSNRDRFATRTAHPNRDGISCSRGPIHQRPLARAYARIISSVRGAPNKSGEQR